jgi:hypothetical protein
MENRRSQSSNESKILSESNNSFPAVPGRQSEVARVAVETHPNVKPYRLEVDGTGRVTAFVPTTATKAATGRAIMERRRGLRQRGSRFAFISLFPAMKFRRPLASRSAG